MIRLMRIQDTEAVSGLLERSFRTSLASSWPVAAVREFEQYIDARSVKRRFGSHHHHWVAESGHQIVGVLELRHPAQITLFFVEQACRGQRIGTRLLDTAERAVLSSSNGQRKVLRVHACLPVVSVYEHLGFRPTGQQKDRNGLVFATLERSLDPSRLTSVS